LEIISKLAAHGICLMKKELLLSSQPQLTMLGPGLLKMMSNQESSSSYPTVREWSWEHSTYHMASHVKHRPCLMIQSANK